MNLHGLVSPIIAAVNPMIPVTIRLSTGPGATAASGKRTPTYATPGAFTGSIADDTLTVTAIASGVLQVGQTIIGDDVEDDTKIIALDTGEGGTGDYIVDKPQTVASEDMTTLFSMMAQIQPLSYGNLRQLEGLNIGGVEFKAYLFGQVDSITRSKGKGGDLLTIPAGFPTAAGNYLITAVFEQWPDWCAVGCTLQNP